MPALSCQACGNEVGDAERYLLFHRRRHEPYCSETCLVVTIEHRRRARAAAGRRWWFGAAALALAAGGGWHLWHRCRKPLPETIRFEASDLRPPPAPRPGPVFYGPAWPPTDDDWRLAFAATRWTYPLPGPERQPPAADGRILEARSSGSGQPPACRQPGRCGVDLGGSLWGERVFAAADGVVDHVEHLDHDRSDVYLRVSHLGGMVFTHFFHLAAVPRTVRRGSVVKAGEVIGLVGDMGDERPGPYIHFALSVRPSPDLPEVYWDPTPLMASWPLRVPPHGTVAGYVPPETALVTPPLRRRGR
jgi:hypothetical protein